MANIYIMKNFSKLFNNLYSQVHDLKYYSAAMAEFYAKRENEIATAISMEGTYTDDDYVTVTDSNDTVIYVPLKEMVENQDDIMHEIQCYLTTDKSQVISYNVAEVVAFLTDQYSRAVSLRSLYDYISTLNGDAIFDGTKVMDIINLKINTSYIPTDVKSRLASYNGHAAIDVMVNTIKTSAPIPTGEVFDFSDYSNNYLDIVQGAIGSIITDLTAGLAEIFAALNVFENLGETLLKAIERLGKNIISKVAYPLFTDYEVNKENEPYFDIPFQTFTWPSMGIFDLWIKQALHELSDPDKIYASRLDSAMLLQSQGIGNASNLGLLPPHRVLLTNQQASDARMHIVQSLHETGYLEMIVAGVLIRIVKYEGKVWCGFFTTYYWQNGSIDYSSSPHSQYMLVPEYPDGNYLNISDNSGLVTSVDQPSNETIVKSIWYRNDTFKGVYSAPIWYAGHHLSPVKPTDNLYSKFLGVEPNEYAINTIIGRLPGNKAISLTGSLYDNYTPSVMAGEGRNICQMLLAYGAALINPRADWDSMIQGLAFSVSDDTNTYYITTTKDYKWVDSDDVDHVETIPINTIFYPFYNTHCGPAVVHGQSNVEREKELKTFIYSLIAVAAAITLTIGATKLRKTLKKKSLIANARFQQLLRSTDLTDKTQVDALYKSQRTAKVWNTIAGVTGSSTMIESVDSLLKGQISDDAQVVIDLISGR